MTIDWFRKPVGNDPGTLNVCYNALDRHVVRGRADDEFAVFDERAWSYADLLAEVGAFAGALRSFGVGVGDAVLIGRLPQLEAAVASLAVARLGAVGWYADASADDVRRVLADASPRVAVLPTTADVELGEIPLITVDDSSELAVDGSNTLSWETVMRAGRTDPAPCAAVLASSVFEVRDGETISVLGACSKV